MPIDFQRERIIPLARVPELPFIPPRRRGARLCPSTVWRWVRQGRLESALVGGQRVTSIEAVVRFLEVTPTTNTTTRVPGPTSGLPRGASAEREAEQLGL